MNARITTFSREGLTFDVLDEGPVDGDPVVLLHGFPERNTCWREVAPLLHARGLRTLAPDQRGFSPRARPTRRRDYEVSRYALDAHALIEEVGRPAHLVGHDWGAATAWITAAMRPDLVRTLTAVSVPHPLAFAQSMLSSRQLFKSWYMFAFNVPRVPERLAARKGGPFDRGLRDSGMDRDEVERFRREVVDYGALPGGLGWYRAMFIGNASRRYPSVAMPTTMVWSDGDTYVGRRGIELTERCVRADYELVELPGVSHWIPTHAPEPLADAILSRVDSVAPS